MFANYQMQNTISTNIAINFINDDLMAKVQRGIKFKQSERKVIKRMPKIVSNSVLMTLLDPCVKNTNRNSSILIEKSSIDEVSQKKKEGELVKVPRKNYSVFAKPSQQLNKITQLSKQCEMRANSRRTTQSSNLIKLPEVEDDDSPQLKEIKKKKHLQMKYYEQIERNKGQNDKNRKKSIQQKKDSLSECIYHHTYDYQSNILKVDSSQLNNFPENEEKRSFLDVIKETLDKQIENDRLIKKLKEIEQFNQKQIRNVPPHKIGKVEQNSEQLEMQVEKQLIDPQIKPEYMFQKSYINSLSKDIQSYLSQGIKLITHEQSIVEQKPISNQKSYKIKEENIVFQKQRKKKKKTQTSQSIIYNYQNKLKQKNNQDFREEQSFHVDQSQIENEYKSMQLEKDKQYGALSEMLKNHSKNLTIDTSSHQNYIRLPALARNTKIITGRKRNATEQKLTRGLQGIQINIPTPQSKVNKKDNKSGYFTALGAYKQTESSLQQMQSDKVYSARSRMMSKKQVVRDYYSNYKEQFRLKMKKISQVIKLYN